ncbi:MAG: transporter substrate-binding domain-containing protein [Anaerolineaceae bacterium]|nr:transporter substrate-binding domain-containing protein [Anaerolineaceae bacterium]
MFKPVLLCILIVTLCLMGGLTVVLAQTQSETGPTLSAILARGEVNCGLNQDLPGFGYLDPNTGEVKGFDVDFCRALAAAVLGDASAMNPNLYTTEDGLAALQTGEIDVLFHNVVWTLSEDTVPQIAYGPPNFYNGQSFMTRRDSLFQSWDVMDGVTICQSEDSTTTAELDYEMTRRGLFYQIDSFPTSEQALQAFVQGQCDAMSDGRMELELMRQSVASPESYQVWDEIYTREPFAPVVRYGDDQWNNIVTWTVFGVITAEIEGVTSANVDDLLRAAGEGDADYLARVGPGTARLLDPTLGLGERLGLANNFMAQVIREAGSYGEIYDRNLSSGRLALSPGPNALWLNGGLVYAPSWR